MRCCHERGLNTPARMREAPRTLKRIGLLGGMSWESSAEYYRRAGALLAAEAAALEAAGAELLVLCRTSTSAGSETRTASRCWCPTSRTAGSCTT
jgi:hypothetical protein